MRDEPGAASEPDAEIEVTVAETDVPDGIEKLKGSPVGTDDASIVGDAGPYDIPPGPD